MIRQPVGGDEETKGNKNGNDEQHTRSSFQRTSRRVSDTTAELLSAGQESNPHSETVSHQTEECFQTALSF
jgi:hypothetical protein